MKRLSTVSVASSLGNPLFYTGRNYADGAETDQTTNRISVTSYRKTNGTLIAGTGFLYEYDAAGNLSRVREMVTDSTYRTLAEYSYDSQNQLSYEVRYSYVGNNLTGSLTSLHYFYDTAGNLLKVEENDVEIETYAYGNAKWQDLLTAYNGHTILYEGQTGSNTAPLSGNPITWYNGSGTEFTSLYWEQGRRLRSMQYQDAANQYQADFRYDMDGIRTEKNVDGRIHKYVTQSGKVMRETVCEGSTLQYTLDFVYDAGGQPFALIRTMPDNTKTTYYYVLNAQGDVVKLINASGTTYATYRYDAWGRLLSATGTLAEVNPLRYRGYYYDTETGWYYLQSRYYDPIVKRFINADSRVSTGLGMLGYNSFCYCNNMPPIAADFTGEETMIWAFIYDGDPGFVHRTVQKHIVENYGVLMEAVVMKNDNPVGRVDLYTVGGEAWEVKTVYSEATAYKQLEKYIGGTTLVTKIKIETAGSKNAFNGSFCILYGDQPLIVTYNTPTPGVVVYDVKRPRYKEKIPVCTYKYEPKSYYLPPQSWPSPIKGPCNVYNSDIAGMNPWAVCAYFLTTAAVGGTFYMFQFGLGARSNSAVCYCLQ